jgi:hypothetical protein
MECAAADRPDVVAVKCFNQNSGDIDAWQLAITMFDPEADQLILVDTFSENRVTTGVHFGSSHFRGIKIYLIN